MLAQGHAPRPAAALPKGVNVQAATAGSSGDPRNSGYQVFWTSTDNLLQVRDETSGRNGNLHGFAAGKTVPRYRPRLIVSEQSNAGVDIANCRAVREMSRCNGRSQSVSITCDNWRESAGRLLQPNTLATIGIPVLKLPGKTWLVSEVTYRRDEDGTPADLTLVPPDAFALAPSSLQGRDWQVFEAEQAARAAGKPRAGRADEHEPDDRVVRHHRQPDHAAGALTGSDNIDFGGALVQKSRSGAVAG